ncbi:MAG: peroxiredoxin [Ignavibacteria bacterium]|nr:peroxiredoxin [Ignavibacteria bacterium]
MSLLNLPAPDFSAIDSDGNSVSLSDYKGKYLLLIFYPKDNSPVCTKQLCEYSDSIEDFLEIGTDMLAVNTGTVDEHKYFGVKNNIKIKLLSDTDKKISMDYRVLNLLGMPKRAVFLIDKNGIIRYENIMLPVFYKKKNALIDEISKIIKSVESEEKTP